MTAVVWPALGLVAATAKKSSGGSSAAILIVYAAIAVAFYFFFWRPRQKRNQQAREQSSVYEVGDEVLTAGGIVGHIIEIQDDRYTLETSVGASFVVLKQYVIRKLSVPEEAAEDGDEEDGYHEPPAPDALGYGADSGPEDAVDADDDATDQDRGDGADHEADGPVGDDDGPADVDQPSGTGKAAKRRGRGRKGGPETDGTDGPSII